MLCYLVLFYNWTNIELKLCLIERLPSPLKVAQHFEQDVPLGLSFEGNIEQSVCVLNRFLSSTRKICALIALTPNCDSSVSSFSGSVWLYLVLIRTTQRAKWFQNDGAEPWSGYGKSMRKWQMYNVSSHNVYTTWKKWLEQFCIYTEIDLNMGCEQSWWMKGICHGTPL